MGGSGEVVVVGAGPAGLAAAGALRMAGITVSVLERTESVASTWRSRYDELKLNTSRYFSYLPGLRYTRRDPVFPSRDEVVAYLERYVEHHGLEVRFGTEVERLDRRNGGWRLSTPHGDLDCEHAVVATGYDLVPVIPDWPGREDFAGELIHASAYRNAEPYRGRDVLVVGPGCSGTEIAYYLAVGGAGRVRLAVRSQPQLILRVSRGIPADATGILATWAPAGIMDRLARVFRKLDIGDLAAYGLEVPEEGVVTWFRRRGLAPTIIDTEVVDAIKDRRFEIVGAVERFERARVILADGSAIEPEVVIAATGYERGLETLVGHLGVLGGDGRPSYVPPLTHPEAPGLHFVGYVPALGGNLREVRLQARRLVRALKRG